MGYRINPLLFMVTATSVLMGVGFNNCSQVTFENTLESRTQRLNAGATILINNDATYTNSKMVILSLAHNSADEMYITNDSTCSTGGSWEPYSQSKSWELSQTNKEIGVFVKYREKAISKPDAFESSCYNDVIIHDDVPPAVLLVQAAPAITRLTGFAVRFAATDALAGVDSIQCKDAQGIPVSSCQLNMTVSGIKEGSGSLSLIATDKAGNSSAPVTTNWLNDQTPPVVVINSTPAKIVNQTQTQFSFSAMDNLDGQIKLECRFDGAPYTPCSSPKVDNLAAGTHTFYVRAIDEAGNASTDLSYSWSIDLSAPSVQITEAPDAVSAKGNANFEFVGTDDGKPLSRYECRLDSSPFGNCGSPVALSGLAMGNHKFEVRGYDSAGNISEPAVFNWLIDLTPPTISITAGPDRHESKRDATISFDARDVGSSVKMVRCTLAGQVKDCQNPATYQGLAEGKHVFSAVAVDQAGNQSIPASREWIIDLTAPTIRITAGPALETKDVEATFQVQANDNFSDKVSLECFNDGDVDFVPCPSPITFKNYSSGRHTFLVRGRDLAGNVSAPAAYNWVIDTVPPAINFSQYPVKPVEFGSPVEIAFLVTDDLTGVNKVDCGIVGAEKGCAVQTSINLQNLATGSYTYRVVAEDRLGNRNENSISFVIESSARSISQDLKVQETNKADVLVVIDNSGSMAPEQSNMSQRFGSFLDQIAKLDWQLGIVTTDLDYDSPLRDGRLVAFKGLNNTFILNSNMDPTFARNAFAATIQRPAYEGSAQEQGIGATYRAIQRSQLAADVNNTPNVAFFRPNSALSVIVVSDADETNPRGTQDRNRPDKLLDLVRTTWPGKPFSFHSIIVKSKDSACLGQSGNENYGLAYETLSNLTGGVIGSVCEQDYAAQLTNIGKGVVELVQSATLECPPLDLNKDGTPEITVQLAGGGLPPSFTVVGTKLSFSSPLPPGNHRLMYSCL